MNWKKSLLDPNVFSKEESDRLTKLKNSISVDDNNYILVGKLKSKGESLILSANPVQKITEQEQQPAKEEPVKTAVQSEVASEADTVWSVSPYSAILPDAIDYFRTHNKYKDWNPKKKGQARPCAWHRRKRRNNYRCRHQLWMGSRSSERGYEE